MNSENDISKVEYELVDHSQPKHNKGGEKRDRKGGKGPKGDKPSKE